ncbi:hypothetical protein HYH03_015412 [Edaphochlamys debaryana]|uniref:DUF962 domain-containing protein n=1 Tax=Edaphochlamys debaryana TaxID=47281 RepID=A0A836BSH6_9CHLO|nr:hypothetical protein HYH03_015412 [Edaphochlamys debaryana]|eukprot:KAG2485829.1 hypothetical protein HYH03_015412 [Edaphochlamys debaryana]
MGLNLDLLAQLGFYGAYHRHPLNQLIHFFCVPLIVWSAFVWLSMIGPLQVPFLPPSTPLTPPLPGWVPPAWAAALQPTNPAFLAFLAYASFYCVLEPLAGASWTLCVGLPLAWSATTFAGCGVAKPWLWALGAHVFGWYMQIHPGHAVFEKRKPALMDSLVQAFALAPLFVWFELLFLLGYRPQLQEQLKQRVAEIVESMDAQRQPLRPQQGG